MNAESDTYEITDTAFEITAVLGENFTGGLLTAIDRVTFSEPLEITAAVLTPIGVDLDVRVAGGFTVRMSFKQAQVLTVRAI